MKFVTGCSLGLLSIFVSGGCVHICGECASSTTEKQIRLEPFTHDFFWESFTLTPDAPLSPDGCYRLKKVDDNGSVELLSIADPGDVRVIVVKPLPLKMDKGHAPTNLYVLESNPAIQTATIRVLRMK